MWSAISTFMAYAQNILNSLYESITSRNSEAFNVLFLEGPIRENFARAKKLSTLKDGSLKIYFKECMDTHWLAWVASLQHNAMARINIVFGKLKSMDEIDPVHLDLGNENYETVTVRDREHKTIFFRQYVIEVTSESVYIIETCKTEKAHKGKKLFIHMNKQRLVVNNKESSLCVFVNYDQSIDMEKLIPTSRFQQLTVYCSPDKITQDHLCALSFMDALSGHKNCHIFDSLREKQVWNNAPKIIDWLKETAHNYVY